MNRIPSFDVLLSEKVATRFWSKVDMSGGENACWLWKGWKDEHGYGRFRVSLQYGQAGSHRVAWRLGYGKIIPKGMVVRHLCHNPSCCNYLHLAIGTPKDNVHDSIRDGRQTQMGNTHLKSKLTDVQVSEMKALHQSGVPPRELVKEFGVSQGCVHSILYSKTNWKQVPAALKTNHNLDQFDLNASLRGEQLPHSKLTEVEVRQIKQLLADGHTQAAIAEKFNVNRSTVGYIKLGKHWKHVK